MDRVFSVDEIADQFWSPHPPMRLGEEEEAAEQRSSSATSKIMRMNRSSSEWAFQRFLKEAAEPDHTTTTTPLESSSSSRHPLKNDDVVEIKGSSHYNGEIVNGNQQPEIVAAGGPPPSIPIDSEEYQAFLKSRLELACAAVALTRSSNGKAQESVAAAPEDGSQASNSSQLGSHITDKVEGNDKFQTHWKIEKEEENNRQCPVPPTLEDLWS